MKKLIMLIFISFNCLVYGQDRKDIPVSVVSQHKDTLFLTNDSVGCMIQEVWNENYKDEKPIIIIKSENWIITEYTRRQQSMVATKPQQR